MESAKAAKIKFLLSPYFLTSPDLRNHFFLSWLRLFVCFKLTQKKKAPM